jgi:hypothetical protein
MLLLGSHMISDQFWYTADKIHSLSPFLEGSRQARAAIAPYEMPLVLFLLLQLRHAIQIYALERDAVRGRSLPSSRLDLRDHYRVGHDYR